MAGYRESDWFKAAADLPVGGRLRMPHHDCSIGDTLLVTKTKKGVSAWCFLCHKEGMFVPADAMSLSEKLAEQANRTRVDKTLTEERALPLPKEENVCEWPTEARVWLYKAGISNDDIEEAGIYYHKPSGRVVVPIRDRLVSDRVCYWQARGFGNGAKYLNPNAANRKELVASWPGQSYVVLCEDYLSGFRIQDATGATTISLLGTVLSDPILARLIQYGLPVKVWLDGDRAGVESARDISKRLTLYDVPHKIVETKKDPKLYSKREIQEILNEP